MDDLLARRQRAWRRLGAGALAAALVMALTACDPQRAEKLVEDVSTEADVRRLFGEPKTVTIAADGTRTLDYPRQPEGYANYVMVIGADGKLKSLRQLLNADNFSRIQPGMTRDEVIQRLGPFAQERRFDLKKETLLEWRFREGQEARIFGVSFDEAGRVLSTATTLDPRQSQPGGN
ncbi:MAG: outer membrane protein assembly factor BamE [Rubrivivax sp.]|nr:outer membrane protein assembly factor BamE [Rubrivivax sp.]